jgi:hypothetical protein
MKNIYDLYFTKIDFVSSTFCLIDFKAFLYIFLISLSYFAIDEEIFPPANSIINNVSLGFSKDQIVYL